MPFVAADWSITRATGAIRYIGDAHDGASPSYATVIEMHRALQDLADNQTSSGDDELSIIDQTPSDRGGVDTNITLLNGYNIDQTAMEHLYDGSITQNNGDDIMDGIQNFGNANRIQIVQNGARLTNDFWNEPNMIAATSDAASNTSHRFLIPVRVGGADIDGRRILGTQRVFGTAFTEFFIGGGTNRGNNVLALNANADTNNQTLEATVAGYTDIVFTEGYVGIDADGNGADEFYYLSTDIGSRDKNDVYERAKYIQREGSSETIFGLDGDIFRGVTHQWDYDGLTGTFQTAEEVTWAGGSAQILADDGAGTMWIQLLTGQVPGDNDALTGGTSGATANVNGSATSRTLPSTFVFVGSSTGTAILGAFGVGIEAADLTNSDQLTDLTNTQRTPPNNVVFTVNGLVAGEDTVLVTAADGSNIDFDQLSVSVTLNGPGEDVLTVSTPIPSDTPASGQIFVQLDDGNYIPIAYTSYSGSDFQIATTDFSTVEAASGNNVFIAYISEIASGPTASFTSVFNANRTLFVRIRDGGTAGDMIPTKSFETTSVLGSGGGGTTNIRTSDG